MAKRKKDLRTISAESQAYWEEVLRREELSIESGRDRKLVYGHKDLGNDSIVETSDGNSYQTIGCGGGRRKLAKPGQ